LSLGLIGFIISVIVVKITDEFVVGVTLNGWTPILIIALVMGIVSAMFA
jgi:uncharacterized membrane protein YvlD (DUF360 family)